MTSQEERARAVLAKHMEAEGDYPRLHGARIAAAIRAQGGGRG